MATQTVRIEGLGPIDGFKDRITELVEDVTTVTAQRDAEANIADKSWSHFAAGVTGGGGELVQASTEHDAGQQLVGMGGALALLRWKIDD